MGWSSWRSGRGAGRRLAQRRPGIGRPPQKSLPQGPAAGRGCRDRRERRGRPDRPRPAYRRAGPLRRPLPLDSRPGRRCDPPRSATAAAPTTDLTFGGELEGRPARRPSRSAGTAPTTRPLILGPDATTWIDAPTVARTGWSISLRGDPVRRCLPPGADDAGALPLRHRIRRRGALDARQWRSPRTQPGTPLTGRPDQARPRAGTPWARRPEATAVPSSQGVIVGGWSAGRPSGHRALDDQPEAERDHENRPEDVGPHPLQQAEASEQGVATHEDEHDAPEPRPMAAPV
jgi:hypothetical protein